MGVENKDSCSQRDSAEREGYVRAHRLSAGYGRKETVHSRNSWRRYWIRATSTELLRE